MLQLHSTISRSEQSSLLTSATREEIHVAQILLHISSVIRTLEYGSGLKWGRRKRRSRSDESASPYRKTDVEEERPPPPPPKAEMEAAATASPVTPLAFPPSESDDHKSKHLIKRTSKKKLTDMIEELSQRRDLLKGEIKNVTNYHSKLIAFNSQLKAMKQEALNSWARKEEPKLESSIDGNLATKSTPKKHKLGVETGTHPQPLVEDRTAEIFRSSFLPPAQFHLHNGIGSIRHVGSNGIPDLNVCAEEILWVDRDQPLDWVAADRRSRSAEARRRRRDIIRVKSVSRRASLFKFPRTR